MFNTGKLVRKLIRVLRGGSTPKPTAMRTERRLSVGDFKQLYDLGPTATCIDLGSGSQPANHFGAKNLFGVDLISGSAPNIVGADLSSQRIPFDDEFAEIICAFDFVEHLPRWERFEGSVRFPFVNLMSDVFRVLKPGGYFFSKTPAFPAKQAFQDPTHVNFITEDTFPQYFCGPALAGMYGFVGKFTMVRQGWSRGHLLTLLQKPSNELL